jgi:zona occludens toxin (predicted ATPase)
MATPSNPKRSGAFISTAKVLIIVASLAATIGGWAVMSAPAVAATTSTPASASTQTKASSNSLASVLSQILSPASSNVQSQPVIRTRSSR